jgi:hypothetical protein
VLYPEEWTIELRKRQKAEMAELQAIRDVSKIAMIMKKEKKAAQRVNKSTVSVSNSPPKIKHPIF